jgi:putative ABC transport system permease protein
MLVRLAPSGLLPVRDVTPDLTVVLTALVLSVVIGLGIGILPALLGSRLELRAALGSAGGGNSRRRANAGWALVSTEIGLSLMLLVGAGLLIHSFGKVISEDPGARMDQVLTAEVVLPASGYSRPEEGLVFWDRLVDRVRALPGVRSAAAASAIPLGLGTSGFLEIEGQEGTATGGYRLVTDDYFKTMDLHLLRGRDFTTADDSTHPHVTIVNQAMAEKYWKGRDPIGRRFRAKSWDSHPDVWLTVIGVVNNIRYWTLEADPEPEHFVYFRQRPDRLRFMTLVAYTTGDPTDEAAAVRGAFRATDPDVPADISTMSRQRDDTLRQRRFIMTLLGGFAAFALLLAAIGIYGVLSYVTSSRTREIGVRIALGARRRGVIALVMRQAAAPVVLGVIGGLIGALAFSRLMDALLYGITPGDAVTFLAAPPVLVLVAVAACLIPARRALRIDPMVAIRSD